MTHTSEKPAVHVLPAAFQRGPVGVHLIGCGGTGSQMLTGLARLHVALLALGHPGGLRVKAYDPDRVSESNIGRQLFAPGDIGRPKAAVLVHRINCWFGTEWEACCEPYEALGGELNGTALTYESQMIAITCVDTASARRRIDATWQELRVWPTYHLDCGNARQTGQVLLCRGRRDVAGRIIASGDFRDGKTDGGRPIPGTLPHLSEMLPEVFDETIPEDNTPSCSLAEALEEQGLYINQHVATWGLTLLEKLFRDGQLTVCGYWINLLDGRVTPVRIPTHDETPAPKKGRRKGATNG